MTESDHDILIELRADFKAFAKQSGDDRAALHQLIGQLQGRLQILETTANQVKGGARVLQALWAMLGVAVGMFGGFLTWNKHP